VANLFPHAIPCPLVLEAFDPLCWHPPPSLLLVSSPLNLSTTAGSQT